MPPLNPNDWNPFGNPASGENATENSQLGMPTTSGARRGNESSRTAPNSSNPNYTLLLTDMGDRSKEIVADVPRTMMFALQNQWSNMLQEFGNDVGSLANRLTPSQGNGPLQNFANQAVTNGTRAMGMYIAPKWLTTQVWTNSEPLELQIPLEFQAVNDARAEVMAPVRTLLSMAAPSRGGPGNLFLHPPGPTPWDTIRTGGSFHNMRRLLSLDIGRAVNIRGLIITNLQVEWESRFTREGYPVGCNVVVGLRTFWTFDQQEYLDSFFVG